MWLRKLLKHMVGRDGFEPSTSRLKVRLAALRQWKQKLRDGLGVLGVVARRQMRIPLHHGLRLPRPQLLQYV